jgi:hypothetical protein
MKLNHPVQKKRVVCPACRQKTVAFVADNVQLTWCVTGHVLVVQSDERGKLTLLVNATLDKEFHKR